MKYLASVAYDGSNYFGFQRLNNKVTIQKTIEEALSVIAKKPVSVKGAGRTDRQVHALDQKICFELDINIDFEHLKIALNSLIGPYIYIKNIKTVDNNFHPRFNVYQKEYIYKINLGEYNPLLTNYVYQPNYKLDLKLMQKCSKLFLGIHNFKNFTSGKRDNYECIIYNIEFFKENDILNIKFTGQSFYRYMVRNLVGALLDVARKKVSIKEVEEALINPLIPKQFKTALPNGLYLYKIEYGSEKNGK